MAWRYLLCYCMIITDTCIVHPSTVHPPVADDNPRRSTAVLRQETPDKSLMRMRIDKAGPKAVSQTVPVSLPIDDSTEALSDILVRWC